MVGQGEWIWWSTDIHETDLLVFIKNFIGCSLDEIKCLPDYEKYYYGYDEFDDKDGKQSSLFENKYLGGFLFLPQLPMVLYGVSHLKHIKKLSYNAQFLNIRLG
jgi:hypothetical protein